MDFIRVGSIAEIPEGEIRAFDLPAGRVAVVHVEARLFAFADPVAEPPTGTSFAWSQAVVSSYKRLTRTITVPDGGAPGSTGLDNAPYND